MIVLTAAATLEELLPLVHDAVPQVRLVPYEEDPATPVEGLEDAEAILRWISGRRYEELVVNGPRIRWIHTDSAGIDHVVTPAIRAKPGLVLTDSGPAYAVAIGEFVLAWMLMVARRLPDILDQQRRREWKWVTQEELYGGTVGIIGLGPIGQGIAERCKAMGMRTMGFRRTNVPAPHVDEVLTGRDGLRRLVAESDWVVLAAALTGETRTLLGADEIALMKPTARLINIARGGLIDELAIIDALRTGRIAGACLDVFAKEPLLDDSPLWDMPNVYISPHTCSGWTAGLRRRQLVLFTENLRRFTLGEPLLAVADMARGY